jgi:hypothetical protein
MFINYKKEKEKKNSMFIFINREKTYSFLRHIYIIIKTIISPFARLISIGLYKKKLINKSSLVASSFL